MVDEKGIRLEKALASYKLLFDYSNLDTFQERLRFQKAIYLMKFLNVVDFTGLNFTWFRRGPYCFEIGGIFLDKDVKLNALTPLEMNAINEKKSLLCALMRDSSSAELYASVAFLATDEELSESAIIHRMNLVKPWFTEQQVRDAITKIESLRSS